MPIYDMECDRCGPVADVWASVNEEVMTCPCGGTMRRVISATRSNPDWQPYYDEHLCKMGEQRGIVVKSRQHRSEVMRRLGIMDKWGTGHPLGER